MLMMAVVCVNDHVRQVWWAIIVYHVCSKWARISWSFHTIDCLPPSVYLSVCMYVYVSADRLLVTFIASLASYMLKTLVKTHREDERLKLNA